MSVLYQAFCDLATAWDERQAVIKESAMSRDATGDWLGDSEPGGCECGSCGRIFIGSEHRSTCRVCADRARTDCLPLPTDRNQGWPGVFAVLYTDSINGEQTCRDDLWMVTTSSLKDVIDRAETSAYAEGRKDEAEELNSAAGELRKAMGISQDFSDWHHATLIQKAVDRLLQTAPLAWQPIETAPEDTNILVATTGGHVDTAFWTDEDGEGRKWWWLVSANKYAPHPIHPNLVPTHWMPLPKHPGAAQ